jgi:chromosome segregation ATPase
MPTDTEERDLVWLPVKLAKQVKGLQDNGEEYEKIIISYIDASKREVQANLESLEEDLLQYRGLMVKAKQEFKKAKDEQLEASYALWQEFDKELPNTREKVETLKNELQPIKDQVDELSQSLNSISTYQIKDFLEVLQSISQYLSYDSDTGKMLKYLMETYKKPEATTEV